MDHRIVAFGCSYTAGDGLPDRLKPFSIVSRYAFPAVLANMLNLSCDNQAQSGAGNLEILWNILNYNFKSKDIVIVNWSHFSRDCIIGPDTHQRIHGTDTRLTDHWLRTHTDYDQNIRNCFYIHHAGCYFKSLNLQYYHMLGGDWDDNQKIPDFLKIDNLLDLRFEELDKALDNAHPGIKSHRDLAKKLFKVIKIN